ncbi:MAG: hypothetical protein ACPKQO_01125 [Nitrososphaeraceae archaeon]
MLKTKLSKYLLFFIVSSIFIVSFVNISIYAIESSVIGINQNLSISSKYLINSTEFLSNVSKEPFFIWLDGIGNESTILTDNGLNKIEGWYSEIGLIHGIESTGDGNYTGIVQPDGTILYTGHGINTIKNKETENATYILQGAIIPQENGTFEERGIQIYRTNSTGEFAFLDNLVGIYLFEHNSDREVKSGYIWKWK